MKVIDLLNKIANGEEVPKYVEFINCNSGQNEVLLVCKSNIFYCLDNLYIELNSTVTAVEDEEEDKEMEEAKIKTFEDTGEAVTILRVHEYNDLNFKELKRVTDELVKAVNELKKGK